MTYSVWIANQAELDLRSIYQYIAYTLHSAQNAAAQLARLDESIHSLAQLPERYRRYEKEPWYSRGWRLMPVDNYCVFYMLDHDQRMVNITRVVYGGRNLDAILAEYEKETL